MCLFFADYIKNQYFGIKLLEFFCDLLVVESVYRGYQVGGYHIVETYGGLCEIAPSGKLQNMRIPNSLILSFVVLC